jgi:hypothetical protein
VYELEQERRGVYAGAIGRFDFAEDAMDTCIAIRTMVFKDGIAYLQAGGGIVFDSVEEDEYVETINKLKGSVNALEAAERECVCVCCGLGLTIAQSGGTMCSLAGLGVREALCRQLIKCRLLYSSACRIHVDYTSGDGCWIIQSRIFSVTSNFRRILLACLARGHVTYLDN